MWKKMLAIIAVIGLLFCAAPVMANGWYYQSNNAYADVCMLQLGGAGNLMLATPDFVLLANGTAGLQTMGMYTSTYGNGAAGACALQVQAGGASQTLTGNGLTLTQSAAAIQIQSAHANAYSYSGFVGLR